LFSVENSRGNWLYVFTTALLQSGNYETSASLSTGFLFFSGTRFPPPSGQIRPVAAGQPRHPEVWLILTGPASISIPRFFNTAQNKIEIPAACSNMRSNCEHCPPHRRAVAAAGGFDPNRKHEKQN
jgi:hypothetical protein